MCKFTNLVGKNPIFYLNYIQKLQKEYRKYFKYIQDDFSEFKDNVISYINSVNQFWLVTNFYNEYMGFITLDNFVGNSKKLYSAEITAVYDKKAWGSYTKYSGKIFLKKIFDELGLYKIKAQVYPDNFRVKTLLKCSGFIYETTIKSETLRNGKPQDIEIFSIYRTYFYKNEER